MLGRLRGMRMRSDGAFSKLRRCSCCPRSTACFVLPNPCLVSCLGLMFLSSKTRTLDLQEPSVSPEPMLTGYMSPWGEALGAVGRSLSTDYSLMLTFIYDGHVVGEAQVQSLDCRLVAEPSSLPCHMEQVIFPKPSPHGPTQRLLSQLERGVLVASNPRGLFVQNLCPISISYSAPEFPPGPRPHKLRSKEYVELFKTAHFCRGEVAAAQLLTSPRPR